MLLNMIGFLSDIMNDRINVFQRHVEKRYKEIRKREKQWPKYIKDAKKYGYKRTYYKPVYSIPVFAIKDNENGI